MRTASANYNTYNALAYKKPVFAVEFSGINTKFVSDIFADIASPPGGVTYKKYLKNVRFNQGELDIFAPSYISGTYVLSIVDINSEVVSFLNSASIFDASVTIKLGFQELNYSDFTTLTTSGARVKDYYLNSDLLTWSIECRDGLLDLLDITIGGDHRGYNHIDNKLDTTMTAGASTVDVTASGGYSVVADIANNLDNRIYPVVKIDSEIIKYEIITGGELDTLTRGIGNTSAVEHSADTQVKKGLGFSCDPCRIFLHLAMATSAGSNGKYDFDSDINYNTNGAFSVTLLNTGLTSSQIAVENIERLGWKLFQYNEYHPHQFYFYFASEKFNFLDHVQSVLLKPHGLFLMIRDGKIDIGSNDYADFYENFSSDFDFDSTNISSIDNIKHNGQDEVLKATYISYVYNHASGASSYLYKSDPSATTVTDFYPSAVESEIQYYGFEAYTSLAMNGRMVDSRFLNFYDISTLITLTSNHKSALLEVGDTPTITLLQLANETTGSRAWSSVKSLLVGQDFDLLNNSYRHTLRVFAMPNFVESDLTAYYTVNKVLEANITDKALAVSTDETATTEAADAYYDNSVTAHQADIFVFFIRVTPPAFGGGSTNEIINLKLSSLTSAPAITSSDYKPYISFDPQSSTAFTVALYLYSVSGTLAGETADRVKVDWISTTASASETPTVEFVEIWFLKNAINSSTSALF